MLELIELTSWRFFNQKNPSPMSSLLTWPILFGGRGFLLASIVRRKRPALLDRNLISRIWLASSRTGGDPGHDFDCSLVGPYCQASFATSPLIHHPRPTPHRNLEA